MKKLNLLSLVAALLCTCPMWGQTIMKEISDGLNYHAMSENGKYMVTFQASSVIGIYNTETDEYDEYSSPISAYTLGLGNMVTNDGFLVGGMDDKAAVLDIEKKEWTLLPVKEEDTGHNTAHAITQSRKYIVGNVAVKGSTFGQLMQKPVIWTLKEDGSYGVYEELPYPLKDFTGAVPKYILINCISDDGKVIGAQIMLQDNDCLPLVYRKAEDGTWTCETYDKGLCEPGLEFPEFPGVRPKAPSLTEYMTPDEIAAYDNAMAEYNDLLQQYKNHEIDERPKKPELKDYASEEANNLYNQAYDAYFAENNAYTEKLRAYRQFFFDNVTPNFYGQNSVWLSTNGKYFATTCMKNYKLGDAALITIGSTLEMHDFADGLNGYCVTNDGDFFVSDKTTAYVYPANSSNRITLIDWLKGKGEKEAAEWLETIGTGMAICSGDGRVISGVARSNGYHSWIIKMGNSTGIKDIKTGTNGHVKVYDLQGRLIKECPASEVENGLRSGIYVINNRKVAVK